MTHEPKGRLNTATTSYVAPSFQFILKVLTSSHPCLPYSFNFWLKAGWSSLEPVQKSAVFKATVAYSNLFITRAFLFSRFLLNVNVEEMQSERELAKHPRNCV